MSTYKVIQDIEADDKLIWQLSFRQFVYAVIAAIFLYASYLLLVSGAPYMVIITVPIAFFFGFLAYPFGKDQPTEVWALARLRFLLKPRRRIWAQSGVKELVTITVPKRVETLLTNGLSQTEVKSRLQALADTIDSRGWTIKNVDNTFKSPLDTSSSDRLISTAAIPTDEPSDVANAGDMLDVNDNPLAQKMDQMLISNANKHRQELIDSLDKMREEEAAKKEGIAKPAAVSTGNDFAYSASTDDNGLLHSSDGIDVRPEDLPRGHRHIELNNMRTVRAIRPGHDLPLAKSSKPESTAQNDPDIINLARRNDLNVDVIGHEINKARGTDLDSQDEVTISLH